MLACASMGAPVKGSWGSYQAWQAEGNRKQGYKYPALGPRKGVLGPKGKAFYESPWVAA